MSTTTRRLAPMMPVDAPSRNVSDTQLLAVVCLGYGQLSKINMAAVLVMCRIMYNVIIFVPNACTLPYLMVFLNSTF